MIQAVILAGGKGERLRPLTNNIPKPMIQVSGRPFLEYQLELLKKFGIKKIIFLTGYLHDVIENHFGSGEKMGLDIKYSREAEPLGTGGAIKNAKKLIENEFMLLNGDTFLLLDYKNLVDSFWSAGSKGLIVAFNNEAGQILGNMTLDEKNYVTRYQNPGQKQLKFIDAGVAVYEKKVIDMIPDNKFVSLEKEIYPILIQKRQLVGYKTKQQFFDIGSFDGIKRFENFLSGNTL